MKKTSLTLSTALLLTLVSCGVTQGEQTSNIEKNSISEIGQISDNKSENIVDSPSENNPYVSEDPYGSENDPFGGDDPYGEDSSYTYPSEEVQDSSTNDSTSGDNNPEENDPVYTDSSLLKERINTLADNVDELPDGQTLFFANEEQEGQKKNNAIKRRIDYTTPSEGYYTSNPYYSYNSSSWEAIDFLRNKSIEIRDLVLSKTMQINTWIDDLNERFLLEYDDVADELHIKFIQSVYYYEITSSYTADNKIALTTVSYMVDDFRTIMTSLHYIEDEKGILCSSQYTKNTDHPEYFTKMYELVEMNFVTKKITKLDRTIVNDEVQSSDYLNSTILQEEDGKAYQVTTHRNLVVNTENGVEISIEVTSIEKEELKMEEENPEEQDTGKE